jgi:outer membrane protein assembly factor BamB
MTWKQVAVLRDVVSTSYVATTFDALIIRCFDCLHAVDPSTFKIKWQVKFEEGMAAGYKPVVVAGGKVLTATHKSGAVDDVWIMAFELETGQMAWERKTGWRLNDNWGGLLVEGDIVAFVESASPEPCFVALNARTGKTVQKTGGVEVPTSGISQRGPYSAVVSEGYAYFRTKGEGLYRCRIGEEGVALTQVTQETPRYVDAGAGNVYCLLKKAVEEVVCLEGKSGKELGRITLPDYVSSKNMGYLASLDGGRKRQVALTLGKGQGVALVDFDVNDVLWHMGEEEGWHIVHVTATPHGLVVVNLGADANQIFCLDRLTGRKVAALPDDVLWGSIVYWVDNALMVDHDLGARLFKWEEDVGITVVESESKSSVSGVSCHETKQEIQDMDVEMRDVDVVFSSVVKAFVDCMRVGKESKEHTKLAHQFNAKLDRFFEEHPEASLANVADGLAQLGIPYEQAFADVTYVRTLGRGDE